MPRCYCLNTVFQVLLHLVDFLKTAFEYKNDPLNSSEAFKIVETICKENRKFWIPLKSNERKQEFLAIAKEIRKNDVDYGIICPLCFKKFAQRRDRDRHVKGVHEKKQSVKFKCLSCDKAFMSRTSLDYHTETVHGENSSVKCKICEKEFRHEQVLKRHLKSVHKDLDKVSLKRGHKVWEMWKILHQERQLDCARKNCPFNSILLLSLSRKCWNTKVDSNANFAVTSSTGRKLNKNVKIMLSQSARMRSEECSVKNVAQSLPYEETWQSTWLPSTKKTSNIFSCTLCNFASRYEKSLKRHKKRKHADQWRKSIFCRT